MKSIKPITNRHDRALIALLALLSLMLFARTLFVPSDSRFVDVRIDGELVATLDLSADGRERFVTEDGSFTVQVREGRVRMLHSSCEEQLCVQQGYVDDPSIPIVCIPNRAVLQIRGDGDLDGVSK